MKKTPADCSGGKQKKHQKNKKRKEFYKKSDKKSCRKKNRRINKIKIPFFQCRHLFFRVLYDIL